MFENIVYKIKKKIKRFNYKMRVMIRDWKFILNLDKLFLIVWLNILFFQYKIIDFGNFNVK